MIDTMEGTFSNVQNVASNSCDETLDGFESL